MADEVFGARQIYTWIKAGVPAIVKEAESLLRAGKVKGVTKAALEKNKDADFAAFIAKWKIPVTEGGTRGGGKKEGLLKTAKTLFGEGTAGYKTAVAYNEAGIALAAQLEKVKRELSHGYIRGEGGRKTKEEKPATATA